MDNLDPFIESDIDIEDHDPLDYDNTDDDGAIDTEVISSAVNFTVLNKSEIVQLQQNDIAEVSSVLFIPKAAASVVLRHYRWNVATVYEAWFADEEGVRKSVGLLKESLVQFPNSENIECGICFESHPLSEIKSAACGHPFCTDCWKIYVSTAIDDGPVCLTLRCPDPPCFAALDESFIHQLLSKEAKEKYDQFLFWSYVENNKKMKWCPGPSCEFAVSLDADSDSVNSDVTCICSHTSCWNCGQDAHRPVDCETVGKWLEKNSVESANTTWIIANTKPCPKCKKSIEKSHGCMHMTCRCGQDFCWLCVRPWDNCRSSCNRYVGDRRKKQAQAGDGKGNAEERKRKMARKYLERYTHYFDRWNNNLFSRKKALNDLRELEAKGIKKLSSTQDLPETQLYFITEAWLQIVECRRVLQWTYAYGYYLDEKEELKKQFFENTQGDAEEALERLHQCAERELRNFIDAKEALDDFKHFRTKLRTLTKVTKTYFENLVRALENGLADVWVSRIYKRVKRERSKLK